MSFVLSYTALSLPVAFQKPAMVALLVLVPVGYFLSLWLKKYHSFCSSYPILHLSCRSQGSIL
uniref:Uncharacterized protein n=1 Tax=Rhizophora mucronata TaxID=61149 RepID=A0A2P2NCA7_RHIMU